ncbi:MAG: hypothetical protein RR825_00770 [Ruthenibacterium sp.]
MIEGKTSTGFAFALEDDVVNNMELVDALADASDDNPLAVSRVCLLALGTETRKRLYDHIRTKSGRVPVEAVSRELMEIFEAFGKQGKK